MKLFHLSDLHIGLKLYNRDLYEDQKHVLGQVLQLLQLHKPQAVVIAGDIYDKAIPSAEAVALFDWFMGEMVAAAPEAEIMIVSGNHDSAPRVDLYRSLLKRQHVHMIGLPPREADEYIEKVVLRDEYGPVNFYLLPFVKPSMIRAVIGSEEGEEPLTYDQAVRRLIDRESIDHEQRNVLVSHQFYLPADRSADSVERMDSEIRSVGNVDQVCADVLERFDYAALGHIHKPWKLDDDFHRYCGTLLQCSVSEAGQAKGVVMAELGPKGVRRAEVLPVMPLREVRRLSGTLDQLIAHPSEDYVSVALTDTEELDPIDTQDRLHSAFPNMLEYRWAGGVAADLSAAEAMEAERDPYDLCLDFLGGLDDEEQALLRDVLNAVQEGD